MLSFPESFELVFIIPISTLGLFIDNRHKKGKDEVRVFTRFEPNLSLAVLGDLGVFGFKWHWIFNQWKLFVAERHDRAQARGLVGGP